MNKLRKMILDKVKKKHPSSDKPLTEILDRMELKEFMEKIVADKKFLPHQEALILAMAKGKVTPVIWQQARAFYKTVQHDILTSVALLEMEKGKTILLLHPKGYVKFKCIENTILS